MLRYILILLRARPRAAVHATTAPYEKSENGVGGEYMRRFVFWRRGTRDSIRSIINRKGKGKAKKKTQHPQALEGELLPPPPRYELFTGSSGKEGTERCIPKSKTPKPKGYQPDSSHKLGTVSPSSQRRRHMDGP